MVTGETGTAVTPTPATQRGAELPGAYPNPFHHSTTIELRLEDPQQVTVALFDLLGRRVRTLHEGTLAGGRTHQFALQAGNLPAGTYFIRATGASFVQTRSVTLLP
jgi:hypothetical protein